MSVLRARPALGWLLIVLVIVLNVAGYQTGGLALGVMVAACFHRPAEGEAMIY